MSRKLKLTTKKPKTIEFLSDLLVPNEKWEKTKFKIIVGIRSAGKSYYTQTKIVKEIQQGHTCLYIRNTKQEVSAIAKSLGYFLKEALGYELKINDTGIYNAETLEQLILFASAKNYKEISSMILPNCFLVIHEEFNSTSAWKNEWLENIFNIVITATRRNEFEFIALGNNQKKNNPYFNMFNYEPIDSQAYTFTYLDKGYIGILQYNNQLFNKSVISTPFHKTLNKYLPDFANTYLNQGTFKDSTAMVINDLSRISEVKFLNLVIVFDEYYMSFNSCKVDKKDRFILITSVDWYDGWNKNNTFAWNPKGFAKDQFAKSPSPENMEFILSKLGELVKNKKLYCDNFAGWEFLTELNDYYYDWMSQEQFLIKHNIK